MSYKEFLEGVQVPLSFVQNDKKPVDTKTLAQNKAEVLTKLPETGRFEGLVIYCIDEEQFFVFKNGISDSDFKPISGSSGISFLDYKSTSTYNIGDMVLYDNKLYEAKEDNITGVWDETKWKLLIGSDSIKFDEFDKDTQYKLDDLVVYENKLYKNITPNTVGVNFVDSEWELVIGYIEDFVKIKEVYDTTHTYEIDDIVIYNNNVYQAIAQTTGVFNPDDFKLIIGFEEDKDILKIKEWKDNENYKIGDFVIYSNNLYKANANHTSSLPFDKTQWDLIIEGENSKGIEILEWNDNVNYEVNDYVLYDNNLYKCLTQHTSSTNFKSDIANWNLIIDGTTCNGIQITEFDNTVQYKVNDYVIYDKEVWKNISPNTINNPFNKDEWKLMIGYIDDDGIKITEWTSGNTYKVDDYVIHDNKIFKCLTENSDVTFTETNWTIVVGFVEDKFIKIKGDFDKNIQYKVDDLVVKDKIVYKCITPNTIGDNFKELEWSEYINEKDTSIKIKEAYDETHNYVVGENVIFEEKVYSCINPTTGVFNKDDWSLLIGYIPKETILINEWKTAKEYNINDYVIAEYCLYKCITQHTSDVFKTDISNWELILDGTTMEDTELDAMLSDIFDE